MKTVLLVVAVVALASAAIAQAPSPANFNIDIGSPTSFAGVPSSAYGAAANQPGHWNARSVTVASATLEDTSGASNGATLARTGTQLIQFVVDNSGTTGDDQALMDDGQDIGGIGGTTTWTFSNMWGGDYIVYTYAWAPDNASWYSSVTGNGSSDPVQNVGGPWPSSQLPGTTYAVHHFNNVSQGGGFSITVATVSGVGSLNGFQVRLGNPAPTPGFCPGDGTGTACPCGNSGTAVNGCANSINPFGAHLSVGGFSSIANDSFVLTGNGMPNTSALYFQGTSQVGGGAGVVFGDGLRCAGGTITRLGTKMNANGASQYPGVGDPSVSVRGMDNAGDVRTYQCWYRNADPSFCTITSFNLTNGAQITWTP